jgi:putative SOS response-associated peptidase YedK
VSVITAGGDPNPQRLNTAFVVSRRDRCSEKRRKASTLINVLSQFDGTLARRSTIVTKGESAPMLGSIRTKSRRYLIAADDFYEWKREGKPKQPFCFEGNEGASFAFAGLWVGGKTPVASG